MKSGEFKVRKIRIENFENRRKWVENNVKMKRLKGETRHI